MPAKQIECEFCNKQFWASRADSKWCSERCRYRDRMETARLLVGEIPKSGIPGVTFHRIRRRWDVRIKVEGQFKYVGTAPTLSEAQRLQKEMLS